MLNRIEQYYIKNNSPPEIGNFIRTALILSQSLPFINIYNTY